MRAAAALLLVIAGSLLAAAPAVADGESELYHGATDHWQPPEWFTSSLLRADSTTPANCPPDYAEAHDNEHFRSDTTQVYCTGFFASGWRASCGGYSIYEFNKEYQNERWDQRYSCGILDAEGDKVCGRTLYHRFYNGEVRDDEDEGWEPFDCRPPAACGDDRNNDLDGLVDLSDPGCTSSEDTTETSDKECDNEADDDENGAADWPNDSGCTSPEDEEELDGEPLDADGDGRLDGEDNCVDDENPVQSDDDDDGIGDACDPRECGAYPTGLPGCTLAPGDILVWRGTSYNSSAISFLGGTFWTHTAIVIGYIDLDRKTPTPDPSLCGVQQGLEQDPDCELVVADAQPWQGSGSVRLRDIAKTPWANPEDGIVALAAFQPASTSALRAAAADALLEHILATGEAGQPANQDPTGWSAPGLGYSILTTALGPTNFYCSSLVWWAYAQAGLSLDPQNHWWEEGHVTPDDLLEANGGATRIAGSVVSGGSVEAVAAGSGGRIASRKRRAGPGPPPVNLLVVDPQGRRAGTDAQGVRHDEIPDAIWQSSDRSVSVTAVGMDATWDVVLAGTGTGRYTAVARTFAGDERTTAAFPAYARPGEVTTVVAGGFAARTGAPVAVDDGAAGTVGKPLEIDVLANDVDRDGDLAPATLAVVEPAASGTTTVSAGKLLHTATAPGTATMRYEVCDASGACSRAVVTVTAEAPPDTGGGGDGRPDPPPTVDGSPAPPPPSPVVPGSPPATPGGPAVKPPAAPRLLRTPKLKGRGRAGRVLRAGAGRWLGATRFTYRWLRAGRPIRGATKAAYRVSRRDRGKQLRCRVTATGPGGSVAVTTKPVKIRR